MSEKKPNWSLEDPAAFAGDAEARLAKLREIRDIIDETITAYLLENGISIAKREITT